MAEISLLDSNVLAYAFDKTSDKHAAAGVVLERLVDGGNGAVSVQNLAEFSRVMAEKIPHRMPLEEIREIVLEVSENFAVLRYDARTVADALLVSKEKRLHFYDALLVSTMRDGGVAEIITENERDFKKISWLKVTNPFKQPK